jgi:uncharacterized protein
METVNITKNEKNYASLLHLSAMSKYFIPLGNYILPIILWTTKKNESSYADYHGKQIINFQLSMLLYSILLALLAVPTFLATLFSNFSWNQLESGNIILNETNIANLTGVGILGIFCVTIFGALKIAEFFLIIYGTIKANEGHYFKYPMTINFLK